MKVEEIERLLAEFYEGNTNEQEEELLKEAFRTEEVPEHLQKDKKLFLSFFPGEVVDNVPAGGGKGLNFSAPLSEYTSTYSKKGNAKITLKVRNEEDNYLYNITIYPNGSSNIQVTPTNRQSISFSGEMDLKKKE